VLIHAGKKFDADYEDGHDWDWPDIDRPCDFDHGGIVTPQNATHDEIPVWPTFRAKIPALGPARF
jgi:hypothetical protein